MNDVVVRAEGLGKKFVIWHEGRREQYVALRDVLVRGAKNAWRNAIDMTRGRVAVAGETSEEFWALKNLNFEVNRGEVLGIIGRNGAGKSTLFKILSRITEPSEGRVTIKGRVGSLLEVGTGFHPELTGRENIYLNGAILGMSRAETKRKFDEIVSFAEVAKFLDTPVKRYSSGMYVRLAFAVAAHLEPEILLVDEVLAVGDTEFQKKCLGKMGEVAQMGRTVLFVSHNLAAVGKLCQRAIFLSNGTIVSDGDVGSVINSYLADSTYLTARGEVNLVNYRNRYGSGEARVLSARLLDHNGNTTSTLRRMMAATLEFTIESDIRSHLNLSIVCMTAEGLRILQLDHHDCADFEPDVCQGCKTIRVEIPTLPLQCGEYKWAFCVHTDTMRPIDVVLDAIHFKVEDMVDSPRHYRSMSENGFCTLVAHWRLSNGNVELVESPEHATSGNSPLAETRQ
jgi:homopolymeric O-antigen transport system ATP-binding protein